MPKYDYKGNVNKPNVGASRKSAKGAHGGGAKYNQHKMKYPSFGLGSGFKNKSGPKKSTPGNQIPK